MAPRAVAVFSERARVRQAAVRCARWLHLARSDARRCAPCRGEGGAAALRAATPIAKERVEPQQDGLVRLSLKRAFGDGTVAVDMDPLSLLCRLAASVPPPRFHTVKYAGVLASASRPRWRASASDRALRSQKSLRRRTMTPLRNASVAAIERSTNRAELFRPRTEPSRRSRSHPFGLLHYVSSRCAPASFTYAPPPFTYAPGFFYLRAERYGRGRYGDAPILSCCFTTEPARLNPLLVGRP
ncbi:transposase [Sorangium sp. So ce590]|uniref:transposase n=1 Tax=Sorangium sp. So ce590 TaxID=3133317 RepID=UPI003F61FCA1